MKKKAPTLLENISCLSISFQNGPFHHSPSNKSAKVGITEAVANRSIDGEVLKNASIPFAAIEALQKSRDDSVSTDFHTEFHTEILTEIVKLPVLSASFLNTANLSGELGSSNSNEWMTVVESKL